MSLLFGYRKFVQNQVKYSSTESESVVIFPTEVDFEVELAVIIGKQCVDLQTPDSALEHVAGFTVANDVSARRWQGKKGGGQWGRSKSFDTFSPLGPCLVPSAAITNPQKLKMSLTLKRESEEPKVMQDSSTGDMIHGIGQLLCYISQDTTLKPWTVILTGTPEVVLHYILQNFV